MPSSSRWSKTSGASITHWPEATHLGTSTVLHTGIQWEYLPQELGFGSGMTCWRRLRDWNEAGVWQRLHEVLLAELNAAARLDWSRAVVDSSHVRAVKGGTTRDRVRSTVPDPDRNTT
ncbi:Putative transposase of IS4/5 family [Streptomyces atratus]|uniref:Putative transposase of IS4/5 family n=1 Tax=Streptomyces atratus TaxID=1893 RepID=A0A1K2F208_STRAR|nr:Putative transposase of IS4/5 family [Streptomyces atratus]